MKIEICNTPVGIPAHFFGHHCDSNITDAHDPLVRLKRLLSTEIGRFLLKKKFSNFFEIQFVERIDAARGICLVTYLNANDSSLIDDPASLALKEEFDTFLRSELESRVENSADIIPANISSKREGLDDECSSPQLEISPAFNSHPDRFLPLLPRELVDGECYKFDRFGKSVGVMLSSRRTLSVKVNNPQWLAELADTAKLKNSVRMYISAASDEKVSDKARTFLSYSFFELIEAPSIKTL